MFNVCLTRKFISKLALGVGILLIQFNIHQKNCYFDKADYLSTIAIICWFY